MALTNALKFVDKRRPNTRYRSCFDSANQQISVRLWGPIVMGPYSKGRDWSVPVNHVSVQPITMCPFSPADEAIG